MKPEQNRKENCPLICFYFYFLLCFIPVAPVGLMEALDGWPPPVSSTG